jgi:hypothetical protein
MLPTSFSCEAFFKIERFQKFLRTLKVNITYRKVLFCCVALGEKHNPMLGENCAQSLGWYTIYFLALILICQKQKHVIL